VESKEGKGTTFTILIPVSKNLPPKTALKLKRKPSGQISRKLNILLVDDEQVICNTLTKFLKSKGHQVASSSKAKEGLGLFKRYRFDLVLSDITIPDMDGIELIRRMRKQDQNTKIIIITGHFSKEKEEEARDAGADEVLVKPFRNALLYETMAKLCSEGH
jgi:DNA-binding response OmpR family regulator